MKITFLENKYMIQGFEEQIKSRAGERKEKKKYQ